MYMCEPVHTDVACHEEAGQGTTWYNDDNNIDDNNDVATYHNTP